MRRSLVLLALAVAGCASRDPVREPVVGQWVWSTDDARLFAAAHDARQDLGAALWIGTLVRDGGQVASRLGVSPRSLPTGTRATLVVRLDDSVHPLVDSLPVAELARALGERLAALLAVAGADPRAPIQLDYDAPVRLLPRYADLLRELRSSALSGHPLWITSLLAHVEQRDYGRWFRGAVDGHVLQLFDTKVAYTAGVQRKVERVLDAAGLPYAIGVGAYERALPGGQRTEHRAWLPWAARAARERRADALWVFPAHRPYQSMLSSVGL